MPTVTKSPVHLEVVVQVEGKTILFFFLNQQSFNALTEGDSKWRQFLKATYFIDLFYFFSTKNVCVCFECLVLNRVMKLVHMDSHINLQNLRCPFHSRYSVPTVLGTPTSLTVQSTVLSSLRGNITQNLGAEIERSHEIDIRYGEINSVIKSLQKSPLNWLHLILQLYIVHGGGKQKLQSIFKYGAFDKSRTRFPDLFTNQ